MPNPWTRLQSLLPKQPLMVATVDSHNNDGTSTVTYLDGGTARVRGQGVSVGSKAFVQGGEIRGEAPNLPIYDIDV